MPLVVPEVNPQAIAQYKKRGIIANPNCSTIQMVVALKPLHDLARIKRVVVATYQSVSGAGRAAMDELFSQTRAIYVNDPIKPEQLTKQIAFNVIPHIDVFMDDGSTKEEWKMAVETRKILDPDIAVTATCVRVPVFIGHAEAVNVEFERPITEAEARAALQRCARRHRRRSPRRRGLCDPGRGRRRGCRLCQPHPPRPDRRRTGSICGSSPTICARAPRSTRCRSPRSSSRDYLGGRARAARPTSSRCAAAGYGEPLSVREPSSASHLRGSEPLGA